MIILQNPNGSIEISNSYFSNLVGYAASCCFGISGMAAGNRAQGIKALLGKDDPERGVLVKSSDEKLIIDIHIIVSYGVNIPEITKSIMGRVRYTVEEMTGLEVSRVNVFVDGMKK